MFSKVTTATVFARRLHEEPTLERQDSDGGSNVFPPRKRDAQLEAAFDRRKLAVRKAMSYLSDREKEETGGEWDLARRKLEADRARQYLEDKESEKIQKVQSAERELEKDLLYEKVMMENNRMEKEQAAAQKRERQRQQELELQKQREYLMHVTNFDDTGLLWPPKMSVKMRHPSGSGSREDSIEFYSSDDSDDERRGEKQQIQCVESPPEEEPVILGHLARAMMRAEERSAESLTSRPEGLTRAWKTPETTAEIHYYGVRTLPLAAGKVTSPLSGSDQMTSPEGPSGDELSSNDEGRKVKFGKKSNGRGIKSSKKSSGSDASSTEGILKNNGKTEVPHGGARPKTKLAGVNVDEAYKKKQAQSSRSYKLSPRLDHRESSPDSPIYKSEKKTDKLFGFTLGQSDIERGYMHHMGLDILNVDPDDSTDWKEKVERHERNMAMAAQNYPLSTTSDFSDIEKVTVDAHASKTSGENDTLEPHLSPLSPHSIMEVPGNMDGELEELYNKFCKRHQRGFDQPLEIIETDDTIYEDITKETQEDKQIETIEAQTDEAVKESPESLKRTGSGRRQILQSPKTTREGPILVPPSVMKEAIKSHGIVGVMSTRVGIPEADAGKVEPGTVLFTPTIIPEPTIIDSPMERRHSSKRRDSTRSRIPSETESRTSRRPSESGDSERKGSTKSKDEKDLERRGSRGSRRPSDSDSRGSRRVSESGELERRGSTKSKDGRLPSHPHDLEKRGSGKSKTKFSTEHSGRSKQKKEDLAGSHQSLRRPSIPDELKGRDNRAFEMSPNLQDFDRGRSKSLKDRKKSPPAIKSPDVIKCIYTERKSSSLKSPRSSKESSSKTEVDASLAPPKAPVRRNRSTSRQRKPGKPVELGDNDGREVTSPTSPRSCSRSDIQTGGNNMNKSAGREVTWAKEIERGREDKRLQVPKRPKRRRDESRSLERGEVCKTSASRESREPTKRENIIGTSKSDSSIKSLMKTEPIREGITLEKGKSLDSEKERITVDKDLPFPTRPARRSRSRGASAETTQRIPLASDKNTKRSSQFQGKKSQNETLLSPGAQGKSLSPRERKESPLSPSGETTWNIPTRPERKSRRTDRKLKLKKSESSNEQLLHKPKSDGEESGLSKNTHSFESVELRITLDDDQITEKDERKENIPESNIPSKSVSPEVKHSGQNLLQITDSPSKPPQIREKASAELKPESNLKSTHLNHSAPSPSFTMVTSPVSPQGESSEQPEVSSETVLSCIDPDFPERPPRKAKMKKKKVTKEGNDLSEVGTRDFVQNDSDIVQLPHSSQTAAKANHAYDESTEKSKGIEQSFGLPRDKKTSKPPHSVKSTIDKTPVRAKRLSPKRLSPSSPLPPSHSPLLPVRSYSLDHSKLQAVASKEKRSFSHHMNIKEISNMIEEITNKTMDRMRHPGFTSFPGLRKEVSSDRKLKTKSPRRSPKVQKQKSESDMKALAVTKSGTELGKRRTSSLSTTVSHSVLVSVSSPLVSPFTSTPSSPVTSPVISPITFEPVPEPKPRRKHAAKLAKLHIPDPVIISQSPDISPKIPPTEPSMQIEKSPIFHIKVVHPRARISEVLILNKHEGKPPKAPPRSDSLPHATGDSVLTFSERIEESEKMSGTAVGLSMIGRHKVEEDQLLIESGSLPQPKYKHSRLSSARSLSLDSARQSPQPEISQPGMVCDSPSEMHVKKEGEKVIATGRASPRPRYSPLLSAFKPSDARSPRASPEILRIEKSVVLHARKSKVSKFEKSLEVSNDGQSSKVLQFANPTDISQVPKSPEVSIIEKSEVTHVTKLLASPSDPEIKLDVDSEREEIAPSGSSPWPVYKYSHVPPEKLTSTSQRVPVQPELSMNAALVDESTPSCSATSSTNEPQLNIITDLGTQPGNEQFGEHASSLTVSVGCPTDSSPTATDFMGRSPGGTKPAVKPPYTLWGEDGWVRINPEGTDHHHPHFPNHTPPIGDKWDSRRGSTKSDSTPETDRRLSVEKRSDLRSESESEPKSETELRKVLEREGEKIEDISSTLQAKAENVISDATGTTEESEIIFTHSEIEIDLEQITTGDKFDIEQDKQAVSSSADGSCLNLVAEEVLADKVMLESSDVTEPGPCLEGKTPVMTDSTLPTSDERCITSVDEYTQPEYQDSVGVPEARDNIKLSTYKPCDEMEPVLGEEFEWTSETAETKRHGSKVAQDTDKLIDDETALQGVDNEQVSFSKYQEEDGFAKEVEVVVSRYDGSCLMETEADPVFTQEKGIECDLLPVSKDETTECDMSSLEGSPSRLKRALIVPQPEDSDTDSLDDDVFEAHMDETKYEDYSVQEAEGVVQEANTVEDFQCAPEIDEETLTYEKLPNYDKTEILDTMIKLSPEPKEEPFTQHQEEPTGNKEEETTAEDKDGRMTVMKKDVEMTAGNKDEEMNVENKDEEMTAENKDEEMTAENKEKEPTGSKEEETTAEDKDREMTAENKNEEMNVENKDEEMTAESKDECMTVENKDLLTTWYKEEDIAAEIKEEERTEKHNEVTISGDKEEITAGNNEDNITAECKEVTSVGNQEEQKSAGSNEEESTEENKENEITASTEVRTVWNNEEEATAGNKGEETEETTAENKELETAKTKDVEEAVENTEEHTAEKEDSLREQEIETRETEDEEFLIDHPKEILEQKEEKGTHDKDEETTPVKGNAILDTEVEAIQEQYKDTLTVKENSEIGEQENREIQKEIDGDIQVQSKREIQNRDGEITEQNTSKILDQQERKIQNMKELEDETISKVIPDDDIEDKNKDARALTAAMLVSESSPEAAVEITTDNASMDLERQDEASTVMDIDKQTGKNKKIASSLQVQHPVDIGTVQCDVKDSSITQKSNNIDVSMKKSDGNMTFNSDSILIVKTNESDTITDEDIESPDPNPVDSRDISVPEEQGDADGVSPEGVKELEISNVVGPDAEHVKEKIKTSDIRDKESVDKGFVDVEEGSVAVSEAQTADLAVVQDIDEADIKIEAINVETFETGLQHTSDSDSIIFEAQEEEIDEARLSDDPVQKDNAEIVSKDASDYVASKDIEFGTSLGDDASADIDNISAPLQDATCVGPDEIKTWDEEIVVEKVVLVPVTDESGVTLESSATESDMPSVVIEETIADPEVVELVTTETRV